MRNRIIFFVGLIATVLIAPAWGFDVLGAKTEARIFPPNPGIELNFKAHLMNNGFSNLPFVDVVVTWDGVGSVQPTPFVAYIPTGCFVRNFGFHVDDFRCGVQMTVDLGRGPAYLSIMDFEASVVPRSDGTHHFDIQASFTDQGEEPAILGILGGHPVVIAIGAETAMTVPLSVETVSVPPAPD